MTYPYPTLTLSIHAISIFLLRQQGSHTEVLLLQRAQTESTPGIWSEIAGGIEPGEAAWQAALRETREETGLTPQAFYSADYCASFYDHEQDRVILVPVFVAMVGPEAQIVLNYEHVQAEWFGLEAALARLPFPAQRRVLREIWDGFVQQQPPAILKIPLPQDKSTPLPQDKGAVRSVA